MKTFCHGEESSSPGVAGVAVGLPGTGRASGAGSCFPPRLPAGAVPSWFWWMKCPRADARCSAHLVPRTPPALEHVGVFKVRVLAGLTAFPCEGCDSRREGLWRPRGAHRVSPRHCGRSPFRQHGVRTCLARPASFHSLRLQKLRLHTDFLNPVSE